MAESLILALLESGGEIKAEMAVGASKAQDRSSVEEGLEMCLEAYRLTRHVPNT